MKITEIKRNLTQLRGGAVVRALASRQCGRVRFPSPGHMWVEFVVASLLALRGFSAGTPVFPSLQKPTLPNSNLIRNVRTHVERAPERS